MTEPMPKGVAAIRLGILCMPVAVCNFCTSKGGDNEVEETILRMCKAVLDATMDKAYQAVAIYCNRVGVELQEMGSEELINAVKHSMPCLDPHTEETQKGLIEVDENGNAKRVIFDRDLPSRGSRNH